MDFHQPAWSSGYRRDLLACWRYQPSSVSVPRDMENGENNVVCVNYSQLILSLPISLGSAEELCRHSSLTGSRDT